MRLASIFVFFTTITYVVCAQSYCTDDYPSRNISRNEDCTPCSSETYVMCYFTNWAWYRKSYGKFLPSNIDPKLCSHIIYGFATLNKETHTVASYDTWADIDNHFYSLVTSLKEYGVKVILAIGGWNDSAGGKYSVLVNNQTLRANFITHSIAFLQHWNFTGLELDWEYPKCWQGDCKAGPESDVVNFGVFVKELSLAYRTVGLTVSAAVPGGRGLTNEAYDIPTLSCYLDWINVMTYDYYTASSGFVLPNSPLYRGEQDSVIVGLNYWANQGACRCKMNVGIATYGHTFTLTDPSKHYFGVPVSGPGNAGNITRTKGFLSYYELCLLIKNEGWELENSWANGALTYKDDQAASFTNLFDIELRTDLVKFNECQGVFVYNLDYDDFTNVCGCGNYPILTTINRELGRIIAPRVHCV